MDSQGVHARLRANLIRLMECRQLSQRALSRLADLDETTVKQILNGRSRSPRLDTVLRLAGALDVEAWRLIDGDPQRAPGGAGDGAGAGRFRDHGGPEPEPEAAAPPTAASDAERSHSAILAVLRACRTHDLIALDEAEMEAIAAASADILARRPCGADGPDDAHIESVARNLAAIRAHRERAGGDGPSGRAREA